VSALKTIGVGLATLGLGAFIGFLFGLALRAH